MISGYRTFHSNTLTQHPSSPFPPAILQKWRENCSPGPWPAAFLFTVLAPEGPLKDRGTQLENHWLWSSWRSAFLFRCVSLPRHCWLFGPYNSFMCGTALCFLGCLAASIITLPMLWQSKMFPDIAGVSRGVGGRGRVHVTIGPGWKPLALH